MGTISDYFHLKVNLKEKNYLFVDSSTEWCPDKIIKTFLIEDFFHFHRCQRHRWWTLSCKDLRDFPNKFENGLNGILGGLEENWFLKKTWSQKSHDTFPFRNNAAELFAIPIVMLSWHTPRCMKKKKPNFWPKSKVIILIHRIDRMESVKKYIMLTSP